MPAERIQRIPAIIGVGSYLPDRVVTTEDVQALYPGEEGARSRKMVAIAANRFVGVKERHWVVTGEQATSDLGAIALQRAADMAGIDLSKITAVALATSSSDYVGVPASAIVQAKLGMPDNIRFYDVGGNACTGLLHAIKNVFTDISNEKYGDGGPQAALGVEVISGTLPGADAGVATIFGDGGAAVIIEMVTPDFGAPTNWGWAFGSDGRLAEELGIPAGGSKLPTSARTVAEGKHAVYMNGPVIKENAVRRMVEMSEAAMKKAGVTSKDVFLLPHQANAQIMQAVARELEIPEGQYMSTIDHTGNTSAASIGIALDEAVRQHRVKRNDILLMASFAAGLSYGAIVMSAVGLPR